MPDAAPARVRFKGTALGFPASRAASPVPGSVPYPLTPSPSLRHQDRNHGGSRAKEIVNDYTSKEF
jgi:hypothetical protein